MVSKLSRFNKVVFFVNMLAVALLFLACVIPYVDFSILTFLSLIVPALVVLNIVFLLYWMVQRKWKYSMASLIVLLIGYFALGTFFKLKLSAENVAKDDLTVMSYNVRVFNKDGQIKSETVFEDIKSFILQEDPDIICFQEPGHLQILREFDEYPHRYMKYIGTEGKGLLAILSKYPIVNQGLVDLPKTHSNASYADILYKNDTIRVYNAHLESLGITPGRQVFSRKRSDKVFKMLHHSFQKQREQANILRQHRDSVTYPVVFCGDFNNNQFSNVYRTIKGELQDTFIEEGKGYGRTLVFHGIPVRIDFIMADDSFEVKNHKNYDVMYSDHYPVMASFKLQTN